MAKTASTDKTLDQVLLDIEKQNEEEFLKKWKTQYEIGDKFFSPNLSKKDTGLSFNIIGM